MKSLMLHIVWLTVFAQLYTDSVAQLVINEVSYVNELDTEEEAFRSDWIEIFNPNDHSVSLFGWHMSDDSNELDKFTFPDTVISALGHLVIYASGSESANPALLCAPFQIGNGQEHVFLTRANGSLCDALMATYTLETGSYGRFPDGDTNWYHMALSSPGGSNSSQHIVYPQLADQIEVSHDSGLYTSSFALSAVGPDDETKIHYTTTGEIPQISDPQLNYFIEIKGEERKYDGIAYQPTSDEWRTPKGGVAKYQVIRLRPFHNGIPVGNTQTYTYIIHPEAHNKYPCPVVSIVLPDSSLFGANRGIYVPGNSTYGNFAYKGKNWERKGHLNLISSSDGLALSSEIRLRIHGRSSRFSPQKNLRVYGPEIFDDQTLHLPDLRPSTVQDDYHNFILRAPEPLFSTSLFTGQLAQRIVSELNIESLHSRTCVAFINGYYWGIHHIEERIDKHYLAQHAGANPDDIDIIDWDRGVSVIEGTMDAFEAFMAEIQNLDLSLEHDYQHIASQLDVPSFIDYIAAQVFFANEDFAVNNVRLWRAHTPESKWRFIFFDADATMRQHWQNRLEHLLGASNNSDPVHVIFDALSKNPNFIKAFYSRFIYLLNTVFTPNNLLQHLEAFITQHAPLVTDHVSRWNRPESYAEWENAIAQIKQFMLLRPALITDQLNQQFHLPFTLFPNPSNTQATLHFHSAIEDNKQTIASLYSIVLRSSLGQQMEAPIQYGFDQVNIDTSGLSSGVYLIEIRMPMMTYTHRMIVQH